MMKPALWRLPLHTRRLHDRLSCDRISPLPVGGGGGGGGGVLYVCVRACVCMCVYECIARSHRRVSFMGPPNHFVLHTACKLTVWIWSASSRVGATTKPSGRAGPPQVRLYACASCMHVYECMYAPMYVCVYVYVCMCLCICVYDMYAWCVRLRFVSFATPILNEWFCIVH
jgi:hypothetical protein